jgi:hypothetical protein
MHALVFEFVEGYRMMILTLISIGCNMHPETEKGNLSMVE